MQPGVFIQLHSDGSLYNGAAAFAATVISQGEQGINRQILAVQTTHLKKQTITTAETIALRTSLQFLAEQGLYRRTVM